MDIKYAKYTERIRQKLAFWLQMKKQPGDSLGLQFLNFFGLQLDDIKNILEYAYKQISITTADITFTDIVYKVILPTYYKIENIESINTKSFILNKKEKLFDFFGLEYNYNLIDQNLNNPDYYYIDKDKKIIYVREQYDITEKYPNGQITIKRKDGELETFELSLHHVWNYFDEFGALLSCPRLYGEKNYDYKERILDVFKNPANSTKIGLMNGISRELGIRKHKTWIDTSEDYIIKDAMVIANQIKVNNVLIPEDEVFITPEGYLVLKAINTKEEAEVSYVSGLEIKALTDRSNNKFNNETLKANGMPTDLMLKYIKNIKDNSSILWDDFKYNESAWVKDTEEYNVDTFGFKPATYDSDIKGFARYGFFGKGEQV